MTIFSAIQWSAEFTRHVLVTVRLDGTSTEVVLKKYQVPGTVPSGKPPKSEPYRTVPCRTMQWKSAIRDRQKENKFLCKINRYLSTLFYIYQMLLPKATYSAFRLYIFFSMCVPWKLIPQPFALLTQCSTTEPQEHILIFVTHHKWHVHHSHLLHCMLMAADGLYNDLPVINCCPFSWNNLRRKSLKQSLNSQAQLITNMKLDIFLRNTIFLKVFSDMFMLWWYANQGVTSV